MFLAAAFACDPHDEVDGEPFGAGVVMERDYCPWSASPLKFGPQCCPAGTVVRPQQNKCTHDDSLSENFDTTGLYRGESDSPNALAPGPDVLQVCAAYVIDNGEGTDWPHGPYGNLYVDFFKPDEPLATSADGADKRRIRAPRVLRGPHNTHDDTDEWLDDEVISYWKYGSLKWDYAGPATNKVVMRVWESDSQSEDGNFWGRRNDVLGMELVDRAVTSQSAQWVAFHVYTNDHPRVRTNKIALWLLLKTGGTCPLDYWFD